MPRDFAEHPNMLGEPAPEGHTLRRGPVGVALRHPGTYATEHDLAYFTRWMARDEHIRKAAYFWLHDNGWATGLDDTGNNATPYMLEPRGGTP